VGLSHTRGSTSFAGGPTVTVAKRTSISPATTVYMVLSTQYQVAERVYAAV